MDVMDSKYDGLNRMWLFIGIEANQKYHVVK